MHQIVKPPMVVSYGGGRNSTAMLCEFVRRGIKPDLIQFADTGGESANTYQYIRDFSHWLRWCGYPGVSWMKYTAGYVRHGSLERECWNNGTLPSLAFGFRGCSVKWKRQPNDRYCEREWRAGIAAIAHGVPIVRAIGIHAGEQHRGKQELGGHWQLWYPLIEWNLWQDDCEAAIKRCGIPLPPKSACDFCPATRKAEVRAVCQAPTGPFRRDCRNGT